MSKKKQGEGSVGYIRYVKLGLLIWGVLLVSFVFLSYHLPMKVIHSVPYALISGGIICVLSFFIGRAAGEYKSCFFYKGDLKELLDYLYKSGFGLSKDTIEYIALDIRFMGINIRALSIILSKGGVVILGNKKLITIMSEELSKLQSNV